MRSYRNTNREHNRGLSQDSSKNPSRDPSPQKDQYAEIYRAQSKYAENLKRQERERSEKQRKKQEERERKKFLMSLQTNLDNSTPPTPTNFICGYFPRGGLTFIVAAPGTGKTWLLLRIACDLSVGGSILDGFAEEEKPRKSLIFAGEAGADLLFQRSYATKWKLDRNNIVILDSVSLENNDITLSLDKDEGRSNVEAYVADNKPDIVFFDTFGSFHSKNESKSEDMKQITKFLTTLAKKYNIAVVVMHHTRKGASRKKKNPLTQDDAIGSSILTRNANLVIAIEAYSEDDSNTSDMTVKEQSILEAEERAESKVMVVKVVKTWYKDFNPFTFTLVDENISENTFVNTPVNEEKKVQMLIDLSPIFNAEEKETLRDILMDYIKEYYGNGEWFKISDIPEDFPGGGLTVSLRHVQRLLLGAIKCGELERKGFARNTMYSLKSKPSENKSLDVITENQDIATLRHCNISALSTSAIV